MRLAVVIACAAAACRFEANAPAPSAGDAADVDTRPIDARQLDALPACPAAPAGCIPFSCATNSCYYLCAAQTWPTANSRCIGNGLGCLATIDDLAENSCIAANALPAVGPVWIGYVQASGSTEPAGGWGWACRTSSFTPSPPWGLPPPLNEPNDSGGNEDCAAMVNVAGHWNDSACNSQFRYVCELPR